MTLFSTQVSILNTKEIDIIMINANTYCTACKLKSAQVFAISMRNLKYQAEKETRSETDPRYIVSEEYHNLLNIFSKKNSDILSPHRKYNHKIILEKQNKPAYILLYKISPQELDAIKHYLNSHSAKRFI